MLKKISVSAWGQVPVSKKKLGKIKKTTYEVLFVCCMDS